MAFCMHCEKTFYNPSTLKRHRKNVHGEVFPKEIKKLDCPSIECDQQFNTHQSLKKHLENTHVIHYNSWVEKGPDPEMDVVTTTDEIHQTEVEKEIEVVTDKEIEVVTDTKHKPKTTKKLTRTDLNIHKPEISICSYCGKRFAILSSCVRHEKKCKDPDSRKDARIVPKKKRITLGNDNFICTYCGKRYNRNSNGVRHERTCKANANNIINRYSCPNCHISYNRKDILKAHLTICSDIDGSLDILKPHPRKLRAPCLVPNCKKKFMHRVRLMEHLKIAHGIPIKDAIELEFKNEEEFLNWKDQEEKKTFSYFVLKCGYRSQYPSKYYYSCQYDHSTKFNLKKSDVLKAEDICLAQMKVEKQEANGLLKVTYHPSHTHECSPEDYINHQPLPEGVSAFIDQKIKERVSAVKLYSMIKKMAPAYIEKLEMEKNTFTLRQIVLERMRKHQVQTGEPLEIVRRKRIKKGQRVSGDSIVEKVQKDLSVSGGESESALIESGDMDCGDIESEMPVNIISRQSTEECIESTVIESSEIDCWTEEDDAESALMKSSEIDCGTEEFLTPTDINSTISNNLLGSIEENLSNITQFQLHAKENYVSEKTLEQVNNLLSSAVLVIQNAADNTHVIEIKEIESGVFKKPVTLVEKEPVFMKKILLPSHLKADGDLPKKILKSKTVKEKVIVLCNPQNDYRNQ